MAQSSEIASWTSRIISLELSQLPTDELRDRFRSLADRWENAGHSLPFLENVIDLVFMGHAITGSLPCEEPVYDESALELGESEAGPRIQDIVEWVSTVCAPKRVCMYVPSFKQTNDPHDRPDDDLEKDSNEEKKKEKENKLSTKTLKYMALRPVIQLEKFAQSLCTVPSNRVQQMNFHVCEPDGMIR